MENCWLELFSTRAENGKMKNALDTVIGRQSTPARVGARVEALREALLLSKAQFADSISLDRSSLTKIEAGKAGLDILAAERIALLYGVGLDYLYRGDLADLPLDLRANVLAKLAIRGQSRAIS
jgi:transcriptional regulator with XRE-family HTH domain